MDIFIFKAGEHFVGIEAEYIYRIADNVHIVPVPLMPPCYRGLIYYRGDLFDVVDMGRLMDNEAPMVQGDPYIVLLKWNAGKLGLIPDRIVGMKWVVDKAGPGTVFNRQGDTAALMTPHEIWGRLTGLAYGI